MNPENQSVIKDIVGSIRKLVRAVYLDSQKMSRQFGLTGPQSIVMRLLFNNGSMSSADLSRMMQELPAVEGLLTVIDTKAPSRGLPPLSRSARVRVFFPTEYRPAGSSIFHPSEVFSSSAFSHNSPFS